MAAGSDLELVLTREFDAPRALVFRAWTEPRRAARWWGPQGFTRVSCRMDARPGGAYRLAMRGPDGVVRTKRGVYREVTPERIVFSYAWDDSGVAASELRHIAHSAILGETFDE